MLHAPVIGLDTGEAQRGRRSTAARATTSGAPGPAAQPRARSRSRPGLEDGARRAARERTDIVDVVDQTRIRAQQRQPRQPIDLRRVPDLVAHQDVAAAGADEDLGLRDLLAAYPAGATALELEPRHVDRLCVLHAPGGASRGPEEVAQPGDVALEGIEIEHEAGRLHIGKRHPRERRDVEADLQAVERGVAGHPAAEIAIARHGAQVCHAAVAAPRSPPARSFGL